MSIPFEQPCLPFEKLRIQGGDIIQHRITVMQKLESFFSLKHLQYNAHYPQRFIPKLVNKYHCNAVQPCP